jgi:hypothetical protein
VVANAESQAWIELPCDDLGANCARVDPNNCGGRWYRFGMATRVMRWVPDESAVLE